MSPEQRRARRISAANRPENVPRPDFKSRTTFGAKLFKNFQKLSNYVIKGVQLLMAQRKKRVRIRGARSAFPQQILLKVCRVRTKQMVFIHCSRRTGPRGRSGGAPRARMDQDGVTTHRQMPHFRPPAPQILRDRPSRSISAAIGLCGSAPSLASIRCSAPRVEMGVASGLGEDRGIESRSVRRMLPRLPRAQIQRRAGRPAQRAPGPAQRAAAGGRRGRRCTAILTCT